MLSKHLLLAVAVCLVTCVQSAYHQPIRVVNVLKQSNDVSKSKSLEARGPKKPRIFRNLEFWSRVIKIYGAYKIVQTKSNVKFFFANKRNKGEMLSKEEFDQIEWDALHEKNSKRMLELCLSLRGFYLKSGQFLATRHDFMPRQYTSKLSRLHDDIPALGSERIKKIIEKELQAPIEEYFSELDLKNPVGSASIAQVHFGRWKATGEKVALKIQNPSAERLMTGDLKNVVRLATFLQKTELKFDLLSAVKELQKQIGNEFDFVREATNMEHVRKNLLKSVPEVTIPRPLFQTKRALVMTFVEGTNLGRIAEYKSKEGEGEGDGSAKGGKGLANMPAFAKRRVGNKLLTLLAKAWGTQLFDVGMFNADPHPGNICLENKGNGNFRLGLLDWGQVKIVSDELAVGFSTMVEALNSRDNKRIAAAFHALGVEVEDASDDTVVSEIATSMLDTRVVPGYIMNPFDPACTIKKNAVKKMPSDLYFVVRTVQMFRGICAAFGLDEYSLASAWAPYARRTLIAMQKEERK